jgi:hypothetical protein
VRETGRGCLARPAAGVQAVDRAQRDGIAGGGQHRLGGGEHVGQRGLGQWDLLRESGLVLLEAAAHAGHEAGTH